MGVGYSFMRVIDFCDPWHVSVITDSNKDYIFQKYWKDFEGAYQRERVDI